MTTQAPPTQQISAIATSDASGNASFVFPMAPQGYVVSGTVSIPTAPILALVSATLSGTVIGMWTGSNPWGPIEANPTQTLQLSATSLTPNTLYTAVWMAGTYPVSEAPGNFPGALLTTEIVAVQSFVTNLGTTLFDSSTAQPQIMVAGIPQNTQSLVVLLAGPYPGTVSPITFAVQGVQSGAYYRGPLGVNVLNGNGSASNSQGPPCVVPFSGLFDSAANLNFIVPASFAQYDVTVYAASEVLDFGIPYPTTVAVQVGSGTVVDFGVAPTGPVLIESVSWTGVALTGANVGQFHLIDNAAGGTFFTQWLPGLGSATSGSLATAGSQDLGVILPNDVSLGVTHRTITLAIPVNMDVSVVLSYRMLG